MMKIPYGHQSIDDADSKSVVEVLKSDWLTQGPMVPEFEKALCKYTGAKYAVCVSSGTAALHVACLAAGLRSKEELITSPITFAASSNCALYCGARPVFADVDPFTANISPEDIAKKITKRTKVLVPVHFAGNPCDMKVINKIANKYRLTVIEDAAHAFGARYRGSAVGSCQYSHMAILSFHPVKSITTGEGGAVLTNSKDIYNKLTLFRNHGITKGPPFVRPKMAKYGWYNEMQELGFNYRMTDMQAALGLSQLKKIDHFIKKRNEIAGIYDDAFNGNEYFNTPSVSEYSRSSYHLYPIRLKDRYKMRRADIFAGLRKTGIGVQVHYIPVYRHPYYEKNGLAKSSCPKAEDYYAREISLPIYPSLKNSEIKYIIKNVLKVAGGSL